MLVRAAQLGRAAAYANLRLACCWWLCTMNLNVAKTVFEDLKVSHLIRALGTTNTPS